MGALSRLRARAVVRRMEGVMSNRYVIAVPVKGFHVYEVRADSREAALEAHAAGLSERTDEEIEESEDLTVEGFLPDGTWGILG